jgi:hypothetical protein
MTKEEKVRAALAAALAIITSAALAYMVSVAWAQVTLPLPLATSTVIGTSSTQAIAANPSRRSIQICNGASTATNVCNIAPVGITPTISATIGVGAVVAGGACFTPPGNLGVGTSGGGAGAAWNAICTTASQPMLILEWF